MRPVVLMGLLVAACGSDEAGLRLGHALIGPEGGRLDGPDGTYLVVPGGSVGRTTEFFIEPATEQPSRFSAVGPTFLFGPSGVTFSPMLTIGVPFDSMRIPSGKGVDDVKVFLWVDGVYIELPTNRPKSGDLVVAAAADRLSYAVAGVSQDKVK